MKHLSILIKKIEPSLRLNLRNVPLLEYRCYLLYDYEGQKIIRSIDVILNEKVMYKDQLQRNKEEKGSSEYTVLDDINVNEIPKVPGNQNVQS